MVTTSASQLHSRLMNATMDWVPRVVSGESLLKHAKHFVHQDVPEIIQLTANAVHKSKLFPTSAREFWSYTQSDWLDVIPILCGCLVALSYPWFLLGGGKRYKYNLVRSALLRGMALCYGCGFLVSAIQHRSLWGTHGLSPVNPNSPRPTPIFDWLGFGDLQLELVSWTGFFFCFLLVRFESMIVAALLWLLYLSIVNMSAAFTYSYGWEWLTCEAGFLAIILCNPPFLKLDASPYVIGLFRFLAFRLLIGAGMSKVGRNSSRCWRDLTCTTTHYFTQPIPNPLSWYFHFLPLEVHKLEVALTFFEQLVLPYFMLMPSQYCRVFAGVMEIFLQMCIVGTGNYAWINFIGALPCLALFDDDFLSWVSSWMSCFWNCLAGSRFLCGGDSNVSRSGSDSKKLHHTNDGVNDVSEPGANSSYILGDESSDESSSRRSSRNRNRRSPSCCSLLGFCKTLGCFFNLLLPHHMLAFIVTIVYKLAIGAVFCFMIVKSKDPIKELFGPAPWINNYDSYFFMTSQGVFGFINQLRIQPVLDFRHDLPNGGSSDWKSLDFKCIPGSLNRTPCFLSPYHSRLDWETWIRTTASFEHVIDQYPKEVAGQAMQQNLPEFLKSLIQRILQGDENMVRLMATPLQEIFYPDLAVDLPAWDHGVSKDNSTGVRKKLPPSEIRVRFFLYEFAEVKNTKSVNEIDSSKPMLNALIGSKNMEELPELITTTGEKMLHYVGLLKSVFVSNYVYQSAMYELGTSVGVLPKDPQHTWWKRKALDMPGQEQIFRREDTRQGKVLVPYDASHPCRHWVMGLSILLAALVISGPTRRYFLQTFGSSAKSQQVRQGRQGRAIEGQQGRQPGRHESSSTASNPSSTSYATINVSSTGYATISLLRKMISNSRLALLVLLSFLIFFLTLLSDYPGGWTSLFYKKVKSAGSMLYAFLAGKKISFINAKNLKNGRAFGGDFADTMLGTVIPRLVVDPMQYVIANPFVRGLLYGANDGGLNFFAARADEIFTWLFDFVCVKMIDASYKAGLDSTHPSMATTSSLVQSVLSNLTLLGSGVGFFTGDVFGNMGRPLVLTLALFTVLVQLSWFFTEGVVVGSWLLKQFIAWTRAGHKTVREGVKRMSSREMTFPTAVAKPDIVKGEVEMTEKMSGKSDKIGENAEGSSKNTEKSGSGKDTKKNGYLDADQDANKGGGKGEGLAPVKNADTDDLQIEKGDAARNGEFRIELSELCSVTYLRYVAFQFLILLLTLVLLFVCALLNLEHRHGSGPWMRSAVAVISRLI